MEGPIYNQPNLNGCPILLNLYFSNSRKYGESPFFFLSDCYNKVECVINYLNRYDKNRENVIEGPVKLVEIYCKSGMYSLLEDSNDIFEKFMDNYFDYLKCVMDYLKNYDNDLEYIRWLATKVVEAYYTNESYSIQEDSIQVFQRFMQDYFNKLKEFANGITGTLKSGVTR